MYRNSEGWTNTYQQRGALWFHDGNAKRPHALLASGKHSNGFFNSELVMEDPTLLDQASSDLVELLENDLGLGEVARVVGPAMGAITLAHDIARNIRNRGFYCLRAYTEKEGEGENKAMVFKRTVLNPGEPILAVEDVLTTGGSVDLTANAVIKAGGVVLPFVAVLVNRSGFTEASGKKIVALIDREMPTWTAEECPLCKEGSEAIHPKGRESWIRLNQAY